MDLVLFWQNITLVPRTFSLSLLRSILRGRTLPWSFRLVFSPWSFPLACLLHLILASFTPCLPHSLPVCPSSWTPCLPPSPPTCLLCPLLASFTPCLPPSHPVYLSNPLLASFIPSFPPWALPTRRPPLPPSPSMWEFGLGPHPNDSPSPPGDCHSTNALAATHSRILHVHRGSRPDQTRKSRQNRESRESRKIRKSRNNKKSRKVGRVK